MSRRTKALFRKLFHREHVSPSAGNTGAPHNAVNSKDGIGSKMQTEKHTALRSSPAVTDAGGSRPKAENTAHRNTAPQRPHQNTNQMPTNAVANAADVGRPNTERAQERAKDARLPPDSAKDVDTLSRPDTNQSSGTKRLQTSNKTLGEPEKPSMRVVSNKEDQSAARSHAGSHNAPDVQRTENNDGDYSLAEALNGALDLNDTEDTDVTTTYAPAVTHETVIPRTHEIREEHIYREVHNHDVYHRIQPVYDVEILPARHFVPGPDGTLTEVAEENLPGCTGTNQNWDFVERAPYTSLPTPRDSPKLAGASEARIENKTHPSDGVERTETTIVHNRTLEDIGAINGPVLPIYFDEHGVGHEMPIMERSKATAHVY